MSEAIPTNNKKFWLFWIISIVIGVVMALGIWLPNRNYYCSDSGQCMIFMPYLTILWISALVIVIRLIKILKQRSMHSIKKIVTPLILFSFSLPTFSLLNNSADVNNILEAEAIAIQ